MNKITTLIVIIVVLLGGWFFYRHNDADDAMENMNATVPAGNTATTSTNGMPEGAILEDGTISADVSTSVGTVKTFTVSGGNYFFSPKTLTVNKGDTVKIVFTNSGGVHDFRIDAFNVATKQIKNGETDTITFVADKSGTFEYYCSVGNHRAMGMVGTLTVK